MSHICSRDFARRRGLLPYFARLRWVLDSFLDRKYNSLDSRRVSRIFFNAYSSALGVGAETQRDGGEFKSVPIWGSGGKCGFFCERRISEYNREAPLFASLSFRRIFRSLRHPLHPIGLNVATRGRRDDARGSCGPPPL